MRIAAIFLNSLAVLYIDSRTGRVIEGNAVELEDKFLVAINFETAIGTSARKNVLHFLSGTGNRNIGAVRRNGNAIVRAVNTDGRGRPSQGNDFHLARGVSVPLLNEIARVGVCTIRDGGAYGRTGRHRILCRVFASCQCNCQQKRQIERITFHIRGTINTHSKVDSHSILSASYNESPIYHLMIPE